MLVRIFNISHNLISCMGFVCQLTARIMYRNFPLLRLTTEALYVGRSEPIWPEKVAGLPSNMSNPVVLVWLSCIFLIQVSRSISHKANVLMRCLVLFWSFDWRPLSRSPSKTKQLRLLAAAHSDPPDTHNDVYYKAHFDSLDALFIHLFLQSP